MDYVLIAERLAEKIGLPFAVIVMVSFGMWQILKPIVNNINESTQTLMAINTMLSAHNQRAIDMHETCKTHGDYLCDAKELLNNNRETIMIKLGEIHGDVKELRKK